MLLDISSYLQNLQLQEAMFVLWNQIICWFPVVFNGDLEHKKDPRGYKATMDPNCSQK